jgi:hypothetical protein
MSLVGETEGDLPRTVSPNLELAQARRYGLLGDGAACGSQRRLLREDRGGDVELRERF